MWERHLLIFWLVIFLAFREWAGAQMFAFYSHSWSLLLDEMDVLWEDTSPTEGSEYPDQYDKHIKSDLSFEGKGENGFSHSLCDYALSGFLLASMPFSCKPCVQVE